MIQLIHKPLFLPMRNKYVNNINLLDKEVFERLYYHLYQNNSPYEGYHADNILSLNSPHHDEYFRVSKPIALDLLDQWRPVLTPYLDNYGKAVLESLYLDMEQSTDFVDLVWAGMTLLEVVMDYLELQREAS